MRHLLFLTLVLTGCPIERGPIVPDLLMLADGSKLEVGADQQITYEYSYPACLMESSEKKTVTLKANTGKSSGGGLASWISSVVIGLFGFVAKAFIG